MGSTRGKVTKRALAQASTPIYDAVVSELNFDPTTVPDYAQAPIIAPATPKAVAKRISRRTAKNPKVTA